MENVSRKKIWIAHGLIDPANFFEHVLVEPKNWDVAFQAGKTKKESYLLRLVWSFFISFFGYMFLLFKKNYNSDEEHIGCFDISIGSLHGEIELHSPDVT